MKSFHFLNAMTYFLRGPARRRGFSLIETAVALGVASFALISLIGLLPSGLQTFRKAMDITLQKEMTQVLVGKANQTSFANLSTQLAGSYYFDDEGNLLTSATDPAATYKAAVTVTSAATLPADPTYASGQYANTGMALVTITFSHKGGGASSPALGTVTTYVAAMTGSSSP